MAAPAMYIEDSTCLYILQKIPHKLFHDIIASGTPIQYGNVHPFEMLSAKPLSTFEIGPWPVAGPPLLLRHIFINLRL